MKNPGVPGGKLIILNFENPRDSGGIGDRDFSGNSKTFLSMTASIIVFFSKPNVP